MKFEIYFYATSFKSDWMEFKLTDNVFEAETIEEADELVGKFIDSFNRVFEPKNVMSKYTFNPRTLSYVVQVGINPDWKKDDSQQE